MSTLCEPQGKSTCCVRSIIIRIPKCFNSGVLMWTNNGRWMDIHGVGQTVAKRPQLPALTTMIKLHACCADEVFHQPSKYNTLMPL